jgi:cytochrome c-type biogenesis protein CcmF
MELVFDNENLWLGNLGHFFVVLSFCTAIIGVILYSMATKNNDWLPWARLTKIFNSFSIISVVVLLYVIIYGHFYEYYYAWAHSGNELPWYYMISSFWEGQEGSFLLWMFWNAVIGFMLLKRIRKWEAPVMAIIMLCQAVLASMLLGVDITPDYTFGSSPFSLLREVRPEIFALPDFEMFNIPQTDYLKLITNGTGLNPLLQNYWMVIHPPILFFGFAASIFPFAFAIAGLWTRKYKEWIKPALPWTLVSILVLGVGIMLGGIWAYEALSFGGYWAWDPVENASLVPWIIMIAALHVMLVHKSTGHSVILSYLLAMGGFILIVYSTFLTRSGVLGETSVHSFTDLGLSQQLLVFLFMFTLVPVLFSFKSKEHRWYYAISFVLLILINLASQHFQVTLNAAYVIGSGFMMIRNFNKNLPLSKKEEHIYSREFWMFIASLVLLVSAVHIIHNTSFPVWNKIGMGFAWLINPIADIFSNWGPLKGIGEGLKSLSEGRLTVPTNVVEYYNKWQIIFAIFIGFLSAIGQFFRYKKTEPRKAFMSILITLLIAIGFTIGGALLFEIEKLSWLIFLLASIYTMVANTYYIFTVLKGKIRIAGASVAHFGFGLMMVGVLVSSGKKEVISINKHVNLGTNYNPKETRENILLFKNQTNEMGKYLVTYMGDSISEPYSYYRVKYTNLEGGNEFSLYPDAHKSDEMGLVPNPDTRHYWNKDLFTYVSSVPDKNQTEEWMDEETHLKNIGDSLIVAKHLIIFDDVDTISGSMISDSLAEHQLHVANFRVFGSDTIYNVKAVFGIKNFASSYAMPTFISKPGIELTYEPEFNNMKWVSKIKTRVKPQEYIIMKAIVFPYINLLWLGSILMAAGFTLSIRKRLSDLKTKNST